jgi:serine/threonine-protein kinase
MSDTIAGILEREPDWSALPREVPQSVVSLLQRCLRKDLKSRLRDIGDARLEIEDVLSRPTGSGAIAAGSIPPRSWPTWMVRATALVVAGGLAGAILAMSLRPSERAATPPGGHFVVELGPSERLGGLDFPAVAVAPDGSALAYVATRGGQTQLYLRAMNKLEATAIPGTTNAIAPFFSPDGRWLAFFADGQLKKVSTADGPPIPLCQAQIGVGGAWGNGDTIVFATGTGSGLSRVSAAGGTPERVTVPAADKGEFSHRWPELLPDGRTVVYTVGTDALGNWDNAQIVAQSLTSNRRTPLIQGGTHPHYLPSGHLLYARAGAIFAVSFDASSLKVTGAPVKVLDNVLQSFDGAAQLSVSRRGVAAYVRGEFQSNRRQLVSVDRTGTAIPFAAPPQPYGEPRVSPDGRRLLVTIVGTAEDLWMYDITSGAFAQLTFDAVATSPIWTPDGQRAAFSSTTAGTPNLFWINVLERGATERLTASDRAQFPSSWSPDGRTLAFVERHPETGRDIWLLDVKGGREAKRLLASEFDETAPRFSPDGRLLAYVSNEPGAHEVFVGSATEPGRKQQVSTGGGTEPVWARSGRELFYRSGNTMMVASLEGGAPPRVTAMRLLFEGEFERGTADTANYDVTPDNQRFIMVRGGSSTEDRRVVHVLTNWLPTSESAGSPASR